MATSMAGIALAGSASDVCRHGLSERTKRRWRTAMGKIIMTRGEARKAGLKRFFSGIRCIHGHLADRSTGTGNCIECHNKRAAKRISLLLKTSERYREYNRQKSRETYWKHREKILAKNRLKYPTVKEYLAELHSKYYRTHKEVYRLSRAKRKAIKRGVRVGRIYTSDIRNLYKLQNGKCAYFSYCGERLGKTYHRDHIIALSKGGAHKLDNIQLTCPSCNHHKHTSDPGEFARRLGMLV